MLGIIVLLATIFLPKLLGGLGGSSAANVSPSESESSEGVECPTEIEQIVCGAVDDVQAYWTAQFPVSFTSQYEPADTVFFTGFTNTGCGQASSQTGPFYCPLDKLVYFDLDFLAAAPGSVRGDGDLAAQYIVAHEYGHHVQNVLGINARMHQAQQNDPDRANEYSIALELQADCFAGAWARERRRPVSSTIRRRSRRRSAPPRPSVTTGSSSRHRAGSNPETWTHGSSEQRVEWFRRGFDSADPRPCEHVRRV